MFRRILGFYTKTFAVWVLVFGMIAYLYPGPFVALKGQMKWFFSLTMFGIGAVLEVEDFRRIGRHPWIVAVGSMAQFTIMPLGAFVLARIFHLSPELTAGLILTGAAPGAMASNVMSYIAGADIAYSVSLTTVSTLLCPLLTPGLTYLLAGSKLQVEFWAMFNDLVVMVVAPLFLGMVIRYLMPKKMTKIDFVFPAISVTFIIFICSLVIALNQQYLRKITGVLLVIALLLNVYGMAMGYFTGMLFRMDARRKKTLSIEIGMQNAGLGTVLALKHFGEKAAIPAAIFVFICIITASIMAEFWKRNQRAAG